MLNKCLKKDLLAILLLAMERASLCCSKFERETMLVITHLASIFNDQIIEGEAINLTVYNLAQKLVCLEGITGGKFDVVFRLVESAVD